MKNDIETHSSLETPDAWEPGAPEPGAPQRRPYEKPRVVDHGLLVDVALGGSPGPGDSGGSATQKPPGT